MAKRAGGRQARKAQRAAPLAARNEARPSRVNEAVVTIRFRTMT